MNPWRHGKNMNILPVMVVSELAYYPMQGQDSGTPHGGFNWLTRAVLMRTIV